jgi:hypothetical protein
MLEVTINMSLANGGDGGSQWVGGGGGNGWPAGGGGGGRGVLKIPYLFDTHINYFQLRAGHITLLN